MGTISIDKSSDSVTVDVNADRLWSDIVVHGAGNTYTTLSETRPSVDVTVRQSRVSLTEKPSNEVVIWGPENESTRLWAPNAIRSRTVDGVSELTLNQWEWPRMYSYVETAAGAAITQADVQAVYLTAFRCAIEGGEPIWQDTPNVSDVIQSSVQYSAPKADGWNALGVFQLELDANPGGSSIDLEMVIELTTGEHITRSGRVFFKPVKTFPLNAY